MAKLFFHKIQEHAWIVIVAIIIAFLLLVILGYRLGPDRTWKPKEQEQTDLR
jgi:ABC-type proline/glycine betaine transport system permease subunit